MVSQGLAPIRIKSFGKKLAEKHGLFVATRDERRTGHSEQVKAKTGKEKHEKQSYSRREE
jgi:hypothetical protein